MVAYWPTGLPLGLPVCVLYVDVNPAQGQGLPERERGDVLLLLRVRVLRL